MGVQATNSVPLAEEAGRLWREAETARKPLGIVVFVIDHLSEYASFYGSAATESCRLAVLCCLREQLRGASDHVAELGGGIVAVLLPGAGTAECSDVAERLRAGVEALALPHLGITPPGVIGLSAGAASLVPGAGRNAALLFDAAGRALREARRSGGNAVRIGMEAVAAGPLLAARLI